MKTRVLCVSASLGGGGAEKHLLRLLNALDRSEFTPALAVTRRGGSYEKFLVKDVPVFPLRETAVGGAASMTLAVARLRRLIQHHQPAIICSVLDHVNVAAVLAVSGLKRRPAVVLCVQITPTFAYDGDPSLFSRTALLGIRYLYHRADRIIALSDGVARELAERDRRLSTITTVISNAATDERVDAESQRPVTRTGVAKGERLIVACGRLVLQKGFHVLLEALVIVRRSVPACLWILGDGPERERLGEQAARLGVSSAVTFLGFQSEPVRYIAAADVFVLSSLFEGFGNVVVEAMASGVPVVATECPHGPTEIITHGTDGVLVAPGDPRALADGVLHVLQQPAQAAQMARCGRSRAAAFHSAPVARAYERVFRQVVENRRTLRGVTT